METERERNAEFASAEDGLALLISQRRELLLRSKKELLEFLELSDCYDATDILQKLDTNEFLEERAVCFCDSFSIRSYFLSLVSISMHWKSSLIKWGMLIWLKPTVRRYSYQGRIPTYFCI